MICKRKFPSVGKPVSKRAFEKYKPGAGAHYRGLFSEFFSTASGEFFFYLI